MTRTVTLTGPTQRAYAQTLINASPDGAVVTIRDKERQRTDAQNRLIHRWFADIARAIPGDTEVEVKAACNLTYGRPILARDDPEWEAVFGYLFDSLDHARKLKAVRLLDVPFTRRMKVDQLSEYMDQMQRDYAEIGVKLTDPEARKHELAA